MLTRYGCAWRTSLTSVIIDRGAGLVMLLALALVILLLPSGLTALAGYRTSVVILFAVSLAVGGLILLATPHLSRLLCKWRYLRWAGRLAANVHAVFLGPKAPAIFGASCLVHLLTILTIWTISRAEGLPLSMSDCAVLFTVMIGVVLIPISVGGWGLREFAVVSLLTAHGIAPEHAFLFSLCFGFIPMIVALPGGLLYLLYPFPPRDIASAVPSPC